MISPNEPYPIQSESTTSLAILTLTLPDLTSIPCCLRRPQPCRCYYFRHDAAHSSSSVPWANASPRRHLWAPHSWPAVGPDLRIAAGIPPVATGTIASAPAAGPEGMRFGSDTEVDLDGTGQRDRVPGPSTAGAVRRRGVALAGPCIRPGGPFGCCSRNQAVGHMLALLLLPWACRPLRFSLAHRVWEWVLWWYQICAI